ncbi:hypothetical protein GMORB2_0612 [Geosmithia morbida]|uniref:Zn(2)-C6 fungal-type domain-containing protein n=1 Tax=Geosmithia morbida TaxID=1094350 RepID=A0A9P5D8K1_9HYPO|nr:uncharacterized protein GMORB2_0612 [Geosmithia morbida]KAF4126875.1 hypothetical protein GMORB2_0612 [Geosmithia morbida]
MVSSPKRSTSQTYGRACLNCSRSKCKCVPRSGSRRCERCHRLDKQCEPGTGTRAISAKRNNPISRIDQLEGKVDELVSLLGSSSGHGRAESSSDANAVSSNTNSNPSFITPYGSNYSSPAGLSATGETESSVPSNAAASAAAAATFHPLSSSSLSGLLDPRLPESEAQSYYVDFQKTHLKYFAFLHLPEDYRQLRRQRPFLFLCIMTAACPSMNKKFELGEKAKRALTDHIFLGNHPGAVNVDLLLGLLVFLCWGRDYLLMGTATRVPRFTQMAMTLAFDMRLNKPPQEELSILPGGPGAGTTTTPRTMEERRAVLATFVMSSVVASYSSQIDAMQWTPHMDECLEVMSQSKECIYDEIFALQVRAQRVAGDVESAKGTVISSSPNFYMSLLKRSLGDIRTSIRPELKRHDVLLASLYYAELSIFSLIPSMKDAPAFQRLECLYSCLETSKRAVDDLLAIPADELIGASFPFFVYIARYIIVLWKLSTLNDPNWDTALARSTVNVVDVLNRLIDKLQHSKISRPHEPGDCWPQKAVMLFAKTRDFCASNMANPPPAPPPPPPSGPQPSGQEANADGGRFHINTAANSNNNGQGQQQPVDMATAATFDAALWQADWPADDFTCSFLGENCFI